MYKLKKCLRIKKFEYDFFMSFEFETSEWHILFYLLYKFSDSDEDDL